MGCGYGFGEIFMLSEEDCETGLIRMTVASMADCITRRVWWNWVGFGVKRIIREINGCVAGDWEAFSQRSVTSMVVCVVGCGYNHVVSFYKVHVFFHLNKWEIDGPEVEGVLYRQLIDRTRARGNHFRFYVNCYIWIRMRSITCCGSSSPTDVVMLCLMSISH